jgi:hypothetical protein
MPHKIFPEHLRIHLFGHTTTGGMPAGAQKKLDVANTLIDLGNQAISTGETMF